MPELPTSFAVGDQLDWESSLIDVHLTVELPFAHDRSEHGDGADRTHHVRTPDN